MVVRYEFTELPVVKSWMVTMASLYDSLILSKNCFLRYFDGDPEKVLRSILKNLQIVSTDILGFFESNRF